MFSNFNIIHHQQLIITMVVHIKENMPPYISLKTSEKLDTINITVNSFRNWYYQCHH